MKKALFFLAVLSILITGCSGGQKQEVEKFIQDAFRARAEAVFTYKDKKPLSQHYSAKALQQGRDYLEWSPNGQWSNVKNIKYSTRIRFEKLDIDNKMATAVVYETVVVTWDYIDPSQVMGTAFVKEDAWSNKKHVLTLNMTPEGKWLIDEDIMD